jgi:long-subunit fatty acid transport protein
MRRWLVAVLAALAWAAPRARAQDSVFGIRGLGFLDEPLTGRSAGMGGGYAMFDGGAVANPASLAAWTGAVGWAVGAASRRSFDPGTGAQSLTSTRFPLFGFATPFGPRLVVGLAASDYLDRNWSVEQAQTITLRDSVVAVSDMTSSVGGVTDLRAAAAYRLSARWSVGLGLHVLTGSSQTTVRRTFPLDSAYRGFQEQASTDYRAVGLSVGAFATPAATVILGASARVSTPLEATAADTSVRVRMPVELAAGVYFAPTAALVVSSTVRYATWGASAGDLVAAGQERSRDVWSAGIGLQATSLRMGAQSVPLRLGYHWRQLPFLIGGTPLNEHVFTAGLGLAAARGRANMDVAVELGTRSAGSLRERVTTVVVGVAVLP